MLTNLEPNVEALIFRIGFWAYYTILIIKVPTVTLNPKHQTPNPKPSTLESRKWGLV